MAESHHVRYGYSHNHRYPARPFSPFLTTSFPSPSHSASKPTFLPIRPHPPDMHRFTPLELHPNHPLKALLTLLPQIISGVPEPKGLRVGTTPCKTPRKKVIGMRLWYLSMYGAYSGGKATRRVLCRDGKL